MSSPFWQTWLGCLGFHRAANALGPHVALKHIGDAPKGRFAVGFCFKSAPKGEPSTTPPPPSSICIGALPPHDLKVAKEPHRNAMSSPGGEGVGIQAATKGADPENLLASAREAPCAIAISEFLHFPPGHSVGKPAPALCGSCVWFGFFVLAFGGLDWRFGDLNYFLPFLTARPPPKTLHVVSLFGCGIV